LDQRKIVNHPGSFNVLAAASKLPRQPGVYSFLDAGGVILYIGKALDLRKRVASYTKPHSWLIPAMLLEARSIDFTVTRTEREALILEASMVRHHKPKYNIKLKDDKRFPYLKLTKEKYPRLLYVRRPLDDGARYFGPFTYGPVSKTMRFVRRLFGVRPCTRPLPKGCIFGDIRACLGPCRGGCTDEEYAEAVGQAANYLSGDHRALMAELAGKMDAHSQKCEYEKAAAIRDQLKVIGHLAAQQRVDFLDMHDRDAAVVRRVGADRALVLHYSIRGGTVVAKKNFTLDVKFGHGGGEMLEAFITQYYGNASPPPELILSSAVPGRTVLEEWLGSIRGSRVKLWVPRKGPRLKLLQLMDTNLDSLARAMEGEKAKEAAAGETLAELQRALGLDGVPEVIEAYDISTIQGSHSVGAKVRFEHGEPQKSGYRRYRIRCVARQDDYAMLGEVLSRRLHHLDDDALPDLMLIDGGKGQLSAAMDAASRSGIVVRMASLAKEREECFVPDAPGPVPLPDRSPAKLLLMRMRDEAHRFAVGYHRNLRARSQISSALDGIEGLGEQKRTALLRRFLSVKMIRAASELELALVDGIGPRLAKRIKLSLGPG